MSEQKEAARGLLTETRSQGEERELSNGSNREMHWHHDGDAGDEETSTDPFHMVSNRVVGMVCHRRGLNACVFEGKQRGLHSGLGGNR